MQRCPCSSGFRFMCFLSLEKPQRPWKRCMEGCWSESHCTSLWYSTNRTQASLSSHGTQPLQNTGLNHHQPAPPSGNIMDVVTHLQANQETVMCGKTHNYTSSCNSSCSFNSSSSCRYRYNSSTCERWTAEQEHNGRKRHRAVPGYTACCAYSRMPYTLMVFLEIELTSQNVLIYSVS